jgi:hypothetical protein
MLRGLARMSKMMGVSNHGICVFSFVENDGVAKKKRTGSIHRKMRPFVEHLAFHPACATIQRSCQTEMKKKDSTSHNAPSILDRTMSTIDCAQSVTLSDSLERRAHTVEQARVEQKTAAYQGDKSSRCAERPLGRPWRAREPTALAAPSCGSLQLFEELFKGVLPAHRRTGRV